MEQRFVEIIDQIDGARSLIVKLYRKTKNSPVLMSVGKMSKNGSYMPFYQDNPVIICQVEEGLWHELLKVYHLFQEHYPKKRTLFFRYNTQRPSRGIELFTASSMPLTSKLDLALD